MKPASLSRFTDACRTASWGRGLRHGIITSTISPGAQPTDLHGHPPLVPVRSRETTEPLTSSGRYVLSIPAGPAGRPIVRDDLTVLDVSDVHVAVRLLITSLRHVGNRSRRTSASS